MCPEKTAMAIAGARVQPRLVWPRPTGSGCRDDAAEPASRFAAQRQFGTR